MAALPLAAVPSAGGGTGRDRSAAEAGRLRAGDAERREEVVLDVEDEEEAELEVEMEEVEVVLPEEGVR